MRGWASVMVLYFHLGIFSPSAIFTWVPFTVVASGWSGVMLFFVISGYILTKKFDAGDYNIKAKFSPLKYYLRRIFRIWPLYMVFVPIMMYLSHVTLVWEDFLFLENYFYNTFVLNPLWTLCVEELFYLILPLWLLMFKGKYWWAHLIGVLVVDFGYYFLTGALLHPTTATCPAADKFIYAIAPTCTTYLDSQFPLFIVAYALGTLAARGKVVKMDNYILVFVWGIMSCFLVVDGPYTNTLGYIAIYYLILCNLKDNKFFTNKVSQFLGSLTYPIYLLGVPMLALGSYLFPNAYIGVVLIDTVGTIALAYIIHRCFENPTIALGRKIELKIWQ